MLLCNLSMRAPHSCPVPGEQLRSVALWTDCRVLHCQCYLQLLRRTKANFSPWTCKLLGSCFSSALLPHSSSFTRLGTGWMNTGHVDLCTAFRFFLPKMRFSSWILWWGRGKKAPKLMEERVQQEAANSRGHIFCEFVPLSFKGSYLF